MSEQERDEQRQTGVDSSGSAPATISERYPELAELQRDIERCLKNNRKFLDHFLDEDFIDELEDDADDFGDDMEPEL
ncbi:hypothetical protein EDC39_104198 [Geothermobacter ehrlichii]|uniref:Uncharacterized protein n=1 Tax=Geothermobacter ehrlichii TaxID=213224 RepID=A0A5D3WLQ6_9BACT|nr:hypothetical protein [Geothermobacter ehrlichii]TYO99074.1 hypothetical protein EDC39_104198 [Geothermobacter ehrlichii]